LEVFLGFDAEGKKLRKFETVHGRKADAKRRLRELQAELDAGFTPARGKYPLREWLDSWMSEVIVPNRRQTTVDRYRVIIRDYLLPYLGNLELNKVSPSHIQKLDAQLLAKGLSPATVKMARNVLSGALRHAVAMEIILRNPVSAVRAPTARKKEAEIPDMEAVRQVLARAKEEDHYLWPCIHLVAYTGMRRGEALALRWDRVDLDNQRLQIIDSLVVTSEGVKLQPPKSTSGERIVDLDDTTVSVLRYHRQKQIETAEALGSGPSEILFPHQKGWGWCYPNDLVKAINALAKRAGSPGVTFRSLRHFHASVALQTGQDIVVISKRLGHSNVSITSDIYAHALPGWQREAAKAFESAMSDKEG
jgi:integrase